VAPFLISGEKISFPNLVGPIAKNIPFRFGANPGQAASVVGIIDDFSVYNYTKNVFNNINPAYPDGYFTYTRPTFGGKGTFDSILPTTKPQAQEISTSTSIFASRGEYEPATFAIYANNENLSNLNITADDFKSSSDNTISKNNIDIRVVKVTPKDGYGLTSWSRPADINKSSYRANSVLVPDLLVYDDTQDLKGQFNTPCQNNLTASNVNSCVYSYYDPPTLNQAFKTNIPKYNSKQIWLTIHVPKDAKSDVYSTKIHIKPQLGREEIFTLNLNVLDIDLVKPTQDYGIWYKNTLGPGSQKVSSTKIQSINMTSYDLFKKNIEDIKKHGFETVDVEDYPAADAPRLQGMSSVVGLKDLIKNIGPKDADGSPLFSLDTNFREEAFKIFREVNLENNIFQLCRVLSNRGTRCAGVEPEINLAKQYGYEPIFDVAEEPAINSGSDRFPIIDYGSLIGTAKMLDTVHSQDPLAKGIAVGGYDISGNYENHDMYDFLDDPNNKYIYNAGGYYNDFADPNPYPDNYAVNCADVNSQTCKDYMKSQEYIDFAAYEKNHALYLYAQSLGIDEIKKPQSADFRVYSNSANYFKSILANPNAKEKNKKEYFYWQLGHNYQKWNRLMAGYYLYNLKLDGTFAYAYQAVVSDPYNPFDYLISGAETKKYPDQLATYPSKQGPIPTIEWENMREGIDDVKYLDTLDAKLVELEKVNSTMANQIRNEVNESLKKYDSTSVWRDLSDDAFQDTRVLIANKIIDINGLLNVVTPSDVVIRPNAPVDYSLPSFFLKPKVTYNEYNTVTLSWQSSEQLNLEKFNFKFGLGKSLGKSSKVKYNSKTKRYYVTLKKLKGGYKYDLTNIKYQNGRGKYSYLVNYDGHNSKIKQFKTFNRFQSILYFYKKCQKQKINPKKKVKPTDSVLNGQAYNYYQSPTSLANIKKEICK